MEINSYIPNSTVEGPGLRFVIWVQGCSIQCAGCANKHMWARGRGQGITVDEIYEKIRMQSDIEGVTFLGGEPFDQAKSLASLAKRLKKLKKSVVTFTGYLFEDLIKTGNKDHRELLANTDLLIDGPFQQEKQTEAYPWVGSSNQRYIHISNRYIDYDFLAVENRIEVRYDIDRKEIIVNGMDNLEHIKNLFLRLKNMGITN